ncbi:MAG: ribonuclease R [Gammaproteobacteria bacterium]|nr:ribonuclease R [Gammaproteobacteria bacterium]
MSKTKKRQWQVDDSEAASEAARYENPVPSRKYILSYLDEVARPMGGGRLARAFSLSAEEKTAFRTRLQAMVRDGQLLRNRTGDYCLAARLDLIAGRVSAHKDGFGFLIPDEGDEDVYLSAREMRALMHGDRVAVQVTGKDHRGRAEGKVVEVLERNTHEVVGRLHKESGVSFVVPDNPRINHQISIKPGATMRARPGQIVLAEIIEQPGHRSQPVGKVIRVLGNDGAPGMEVQIAIHAHNLPHQWPDSVLRAADSFGDHITADAASGLTDLRDTPLVTIDGADARDFDDAVYCEPAGKGWRLLVAIADVSHYVEKDSALDREALERGTSVYFTDRVIPMLPEALSNGLCSLNPKVDRLAMICEMKVANNGSVRGAKFYEAVIRSAARLTYTEVSDMMVKGDAALRKRHAALLPYLDSLFDVYRAFGKARRARGSIEFEMAQSYMVLGEDRRVERIETYERNDAHRLIEECMIAANVQAARFLKRHKMPTLFRVHGGPHADRMEKLREFLATLGISMPRVEKPEPRHFGELLKKVAGRADAQLIETLVLRAMDRAVYSPDNVGHFGLALSEYAHFTSPIRRYPDLLVHRALRHVLAGGGPGDFAYSMRNMQQLGQRCSDAERRADEATRDATDWLKCEFMQDKVGEVFDGIITGVTNFGLFVQLTKFHIEGLVHVTSLESDYYRHDPVRHCLVGERSGLTFGLTDAMKVKVSSVDMEQRRIDFAPATSDRPEERVGKRASGKGAKKGDRKQRKSKGTKGRSKARANKSGSGGSKRKAGGRGSSGKRK